MFDSSDGLVSPCFNLCSFFPVYCMPVLAAKKERKRGEGGWGERRRAIESFRVSVDRESDENSIKGKKGKTR